MVLTTEILNMLAKEPVSDANKYDFVKSIILKRYNLNSEKLKQCFYLHQKSAEKSWRNFAHKLNSYFTEWIFELEVKTFEQLKDLIITEQMKYPVLAEMREHFLHERKDMKTLYDLTIKFDEYENIKQSFRWEFPKKNDHKFQTGGNYSGSKSKEAFKEMKSKFQIKIEPVNEKVHEKDFEKRRQLHCYECESYSHLQQQQDKLMKNFETIASNEIVRNRSHNALAPYTSMGEVNRIEMLILRETSATLDAICKKYVRLSMYTNETVWIWTPLEDTTDC